MLAFAPGSRVVIRDEEWLVRRIDPATDGGCFLACNGKVHLGHRGVMNLAPCQLECRGLMQP